ncbi:helix-turn-helix domain-containing protein [Kitasatospora sp. NPDC056651]|uniref:helix-turn-helix domain-containing protein n=1 Tax=Kitasatospora sp. NPDC056651 TaxID=3345892 RepID=UPI0036C162DF
MEIPVNTDLGSYLKRMRERVQPEEIGLAVRGARRVPGLRREEVAALAGVSPTYYTRLEQSQTAHASPAILVAIARALDLSPDEEEYLLKVGTPVTERETPARRVDQISPYTRMLVDSLGNAAVAVLNYRCDILGWNSLYHRLFAPHLEYDAPQNAAVRPNVIRLNFLDDNVRGLYVDWPLEARSNVSYLRFIAANHRHDPQLAELIGELSIGSEEFAQLWVSHRVANCTVGTKTFDHPSVGEFELMYQSADLGDGNILKFYHAEPNSPHDAALRLLAVDLNPAHRF